MQVSNIFNLVNGKQEDQLSASFGFILKNDIKILDSFLRTLGIILNRKELKIADIETQATYDSGESRIDLHILIPNRFLIFLESKIFLSPKIDRQLIKYSKILNNKRNQYEGLRLVYVNKYPATSVDIERIRVKLKLKPKEFSFFSWEDLIKLTKPIENKEIIKLFKEYIGDSMFNKKIIKEQKIKNIPEVLVLFTDPDFWQLSRKKNIAVQRNSAQDAQYVAFLRVRRGKGIKSAITHIARVEYTETNIPIKKSFSGFPKLIKRSKEKKWNKPGIHKQYHLEKIESLAHEIIHNSNKGMVKFRTTLGELLRAKTTKDIRILR